MLSLLLIFVTVYAYKSQLPKEYLAMIVGNASVSGLLDLRAKSARAHSSGTCSEPLLGITAVIPVRTLFTSRYSQMPAAGQVSRMHHGTQFFWKLF